MFEQGRPLDRVRVGIGDDILKTKKPARGAELAPQTRQDKWRAFTERLFEPVDGASLAAYRIGFGLIICWEVFRYFDKGWIRRYFIEPEFLFKYFGFSWVQPWSGDGMFVHFFVVGCAALGVATGLFYRFSAVVLFVTFTHWFLLCESTYLNHLYLVSLLCFLAIFLPVNRIASIDTWLKPKRRRDTIPRWGLWLIRGQLALVYFYAGIAKLNADWLRTQPMRMWLESRSRRELFDGLIPIGEFLNWEPTVLFFSYGGLLFDLAIPFLLLWRRTRVPAVLAATAFHLSNAWMFRIGIFPWFMIVATLIFLRPDWPRQVFNWPLRKPISAEALPTSPQVRRAVVIGLAAWFAFQSLVPFRHLLYPGHVHWTEEGHRFSWHMKLRDKDGEARFIVEDSTLGFRRTVNLERHLSSRQRRKMPTHPDMIVQFANYIAEVYREEYDLQQVVVRAEVMASLNGRSRQPLVDASVNLAEEQRTFGPMKWIVPFEDTPLPPR